MERKQLAIKTYVVLDSQGHVVGVKLNRQSAVALHLAAPRDKRGAIQLHYADKVIDNPDYLNRTQGSQGENHAPDEHRRPNPVRPA